MINRKQAKAIRAVAQAFGWDRRPIDEVRLIMWCAFHYYVLRLDR